MKRAAVVMAAGLVAALVVFYVQQRRAARPVVRVTLPEMPDTSGLDRRPESRPDLDPEPVPPGPGQVKVYTNLAGAEVRLILDRAGAEPAPPPMEQLADERGEARFQLTRDRVLWGGITAEARAAGYPRVRARVPKGGAVWLKLMRGQSVVGRVVDEAGAPVDGAGVLVDHGASAVTDVSGRFEFGVPRPGRYGLYVWHPRFVNARLQRDLAAGAEIEIVLQRGLSIAGRVTFPGGAPVPGAEVATREATAVAGPDGRYALSGLSAGDYKVACEFARQTREAPAGATGVDFVVSRHVVRVRYVDENGRPFHGAEVGVDAMPRDGGDDGIGYGHFRLPGAELLCACPLRARVVAKAGAPGHETFVAEHELAGPPARLHDVEAVLRAIRNPGSLFVHAVDASGAAVAKVTLALLDAAGNELARREVELDAEGRGEAGGIAAGEYVVRAMPDSDWLLTARATVTIRAGGTAPIALTLPAGGGLRVRVKGETGVLLAVRDGAGEEVKIWFDAGETRDGVRTFTCASRLPPGSYTVEASHGADPVASAPVVVRPNELATVDLAVE